MEKILVMTDSNSGITQKEKEKYGIEIVPMPFMINNQEYFEDISLSQEDFYKHLEDNTKINTSQPSLGCLEEMWTNHLKNYDYILYIPMSSGLSASCASSKMLAQDFNGRVRVIDNHRISISQKESVLEALQMVKEGKNIDEIEKYLTDSAFHSIIFLLVEKLKYLKQGGRVTPAVALIGDILKIRPLLVTTGDKFDTYAKCRSEKQALGKIFEAFDEYINGEYKDYYEKGQLVFSIAYSKNKGYSDILKEQVLNRFPKLVFHFCDPLSLSVSCHTGPNSIGCCLAVNEHLN